MVVAGGGAGGSRRGGGGGAGGYRASGFGPSPLWGSALSLSLGSYPITVGGGAAQAPYPSSSVGCRGSDSIFSTITSTGGGFGNIAPSGAGQTGGSGGGYW